MPNPGQSRPKGNGRYHEFPVIVNGFSAFSRFIDWPILSRMATAAAEFLDKNEMASKAAALETLFPRAMAEGWGAHRFGKEAGVCHTTARRFLKRKVKHIATASERRIAGFSANAGALFRGAAMRQLRRLERLESIPDDEWTKADYALEKHIIAMIKPLIEWSKLSLKDEITDSPAPQLSDGL